MKTKRIVVSTFLAVFLSTAAFANGTNPVEEKETTGNEVQKESKDSGGGTIEFYGEKAGLLRPCRGYAMAVCKKVTFNNNERTAVVTDGVSTIVVDVEKVNLEDGSVEM